MTELVEIYPTDYDNGQEINARSVLPFNPKNKNKKNLDWTDNPYNVWFAGWSTAEEAEQFFEKLKIKTVRLFAKPAELYTKQYYNSAIELYQRTKRTKRT